MKEELFDIKNFNIIKDRENYYFFRALNIADNNDIERGISTTGDGKIERIRTDRERFEGKTKYSEDSEISLEEVYDHIKMHYRKDTNCISITSNSNIAINYGRGSYKDKYVMIKIPQNEFGEKIVNAGQYMLQELYFRIEKTVEELPEDLKNEILDIFSDIDMVDEDKKLKEIISKRYIAKSEDVDSSKAHPKKGIIYSSPKARISSYQALSEEQLLETNKVYAKLAILENKEILKNVIVHSSNSKLRETIGNAFSSMELIHYGDINEENIIEIPKELADIFALIQQLNGNEEKIDKLKQTLISAVENGRKIPQISDITTHVKDNISIEEMYELTDGKVEYGKANSIVKNMFYLSKSRQNAIALANALEEILGENSGFEDLVQDIRKNGFRIEPEIISRQSGKGIKLSESINLDLTKDEQILVEKIKNLSPEELDRVIENGGFYNAQDIITTTFSNLRENEKIDKSRYYAEAIVSQYNWAQIGIEEFKISERNELIKRLQERKCAEIYEKLIQIGVDIEQIPTILLNIATRQGLYEKYEKGNLEQLLNTRQDVLQDNINIELVERFLGYYDVENTGIKLKDYQQRANNNVNKIFENHKFAQVILPTGAGKSFVALAQMQKYATEHPNEKMLYLAPQDEILNQIKSYIIKYVHGMQGTVGKTEDKIIAEIFPNITFETYSGLLAKRGQGIIKDQYGMIVLDELHRTGAKEWEGKIDKLLENQNEDVKVLGITATPVRDVDGRDMAEETAKKLGYTDEEVKQRKHLASNMTLENAIRMGYVVNPKIVYCKYDLISSGKMDELRAKIDDIEDETKRAEELQKYNEFRQKLNNEIDSEIGEEGRKKLEDEARKNLDSGIGKEEILRQNVKKGGKYIVFIPITDQGDIEDEDGNRIGTKTGEDKILGYQEYLNKVFEGTDITPQLHSLLGSYSKERNKEELEAFESDNSDDTKFMVVMNKANEGLHIDGVDGIIWFRALDENSRILYLQQLGRAIYALDEENPLPDDKRPVVIDLANNSLTVKIEKEFKNSKPIDDLEALTIILEWINEHSGMIPNRESSNKQEQHYYALLRKIQNKYNKYLNGLDNFEDLTEEDRLRIQEIINLASEIDLWDMDLPPIPKSRGNKDEFDPFIVEGILKDFIEFEDEVDNNITRSTSLKNALEIEKWCKENYGDKEIEERSLPSSTSKNEEENVLGKKLVRLRVKIKDYKGKEMFQIQNGEDRKIVEIIKRLDKEYGLGDSLKNAIKIEKWCKEKYGDKEIEERSLPSTNSKNEEERKLGQALSDLKRKKLINTEKKEISQIENEEERKIAEIIEKLDKEYGIGKSLKNAIKIEKWCKEKYGEKEIEERSLPSSSSKDKEENELGKRLNALRVKMNIYKGKEKSQILDEEDRKIIEIIERLDKEYGIGKSLKNAIKIEKWCKGKYGDKEIEERSLPSPTAKNEEEKDLALKLKTLRANIVKKYEGREISKIQNEEERKIVEIIEKLDKEYGLGKSLKDAIKIEKWCKEKYGDKEIEERSLPSSDSEDEEERKLGKRLSNLRMKIKECKEVGKSEIQDKEDRQTIEIVEKLDEEYGLGKSLKNAIKIEKWCKEKYGNKELEERSLPSRNSKNEKEKELGEKLKALRSKIIKKYEGKEISEIQEKEDRQIAEIIERLDKEYNYKKIKLNDAKNKRDCAKKENDKTKEQEEQKLEELRKRGKAYEER